MFFDVVFLGVAKTSTFHLHIEQRLERSTNPNAWRIKCFSRRSLQPAGRSGKWGRVFMPAPDLRSEVVRPRPDDVRPELDLHLCVRDYQVYLRHKDKVDVG